MSSESMQLLREWQDGPDHIATGTLAVPLKNIKAVVPETVPSLHQSAIDPIPLRWLVAALSVGVFTLALALLHLGITIAFNGTSLAFALASISLLTLRHQFRQEGPRPRAAIASCAEDVFLFTSTALAGAIASYAVASCTHGWVDDTMIRLDQAIGFDWRHLYALTAAHPALQISGRIAYASIFASPAILFLSFARSGQRAESRLFLASFWLAALISLFLFQYLPTLGPLSHMWQGPISYMPTSGLYQAELIPLLREHQIHVIDLAQLRGLVGPPSFHAACAILYILTAQRTRSLRLPLTLLNVAMLFAIPVEGTHYAIDVLSGAAVAIVAHLIVTRVALARGWRPGGGTGPHKSNDIPAPLRGLMPQIWRKLGTPLKDA